jgi:hypothetical protein
MVVCDFQKRPQLYAKYTDPEDWDSFIELQNENKMIK